MCLLRTQITKRHIVTMRMDYSTRNITSLRKYSGNGRDKIPYVLPINRVAPGRPKVNEQLAGDGDDYETLCHVSSLAQGKAQQTVGRRSLLPFVVGSYTGGCCNQFARCLRSSISLTPLGGFVT